MRNQKKHGKLRTVPKGTQVWSIKNQANIFLSEDSLIEVTHTTTLSDDYIFAKPKQEIFKHSPVGSGIIGKGTDEWGLLWSQTKRFKKSKPFSTQWIRREV